jgi:hypothetical protein
VVSEALDAIATSLEGLEQGAPRPAL